MRSAEDAMSESVNNIEDYTGVMNIQAYRKRPKLADSTLRGYCADFREFSDFCELRGLDSLPASADTVCLYISACADSGKLKTGSIERRMSAIAAAHVAADLDSPRSATAVRLCLAGIRRALGPQGTGKTPTLTADVVAMSSHVPAGLLGMRDKAMLLVGFAGAFRRSELVALEVEDLTFSDDGMAVLIRHPRGNTALDRVINIWRAEHCPVDAVTKWLEAAAICTGPIFRKMHRHGRIADKALHPQSVALTVKRYAAAAGMDPRSYAGHSLRSGLVTSADISGVSMHLIMRHTGHKSPQMIARCGRNKIPLRDGLSFRVGL